MSEGNGFTCLCVQDGSEWRVASECVGGERKERALVYTPSKGTRAGAPEMKGKSKWGTMLRSRELRKATFSSPTSGDLEKAEEKRRFVRSQRPIMSTQGPTLPKPRQPQLHPHPQSLPS